ncbi:SNF2-related protein [Ruminococcus albus]|uniref:Helicase conserved C-terminal domain-containing protein n=1 Tax=Ruminococcus albus TaxID=1264 RepID=A0A1I1CUS5_RUMAL|nr:SNF2-related protein [Ruminococcus albus]SFB66469.1 Helicase conserved C-terminal domain-containing protein [Ruminococcus albus]
MADDNITQEMFGEFLKHFNEYSGFLSASELHEAAAELKRFTENYEQIAKFNKCEIEKKQAEERHIAEVTSMELPLDYNNCYSSDERAAGVYVGSISDGLILSLNDLSRVDIEYISQITGSSHREVIETLKGSIYQDPETWGECFYKGWVTADEYLSGNILRKYKAAESANEKYNGYFEDNIKALEKIIPVPLKTEDIYVTLGSPWLPERIVEDFIGHLLGIAGAVVKHDEITGCWEVTANIYFSDNESYYGTKRLSAVCIIENMLNMKPIKVYNSVQSPQDKNKKIKALNESETIAAAECERKIRAEFDKWIWDDARRCKQLRDIYNEKFGCIRQRKYDGSFLTFPGMLSEITLYPYQKNAVAKILFMPNTLLAHEVGSGKTYIMIAAGMKLRQTGISQKNLYVVPNGLVAQWESIFLKMYPNAKLLCVTPKFFTKTKRETVKQLIIDEDFDGIIMAYSCFDMIDPSDDFIENELNRHIAAVADIPYHKRTKSTEKYEKKLKKQLKKHQEQKSAKDNKVLYFDELGINTLFVDEAHNYKNIPIETKGGYLGINENGSLKCVNMLYKVHIVQQQNGGRGVIMATATPITNSLSDCFAMQTYLQHGELKMLGIDKFDSWLGMFAEPKNDFEIDVDTSGYRMVTRLSQFHNLTELTALFSGAACFHKNDISKDIPKLNGRTDCLVAKTPELTAYLSMISERADCIREGIVNRKEDNMLLLTTDGRKAALDMRLADSKVKPSCDMKVYRCAENVFDIYASDTSGKCTQLVFCDISTPKQGFNIYDELKNILIRMGIPSDQVAFIHDANNDKKRKALFSDMNTGKVRVLIGSTAKLGTGVNVQTYLKAVHHLDVPWRPADMIQREGRILRQGNTNSEVKIFRYITEGSFDAYSWQILEIKQRFITQLISGELSERSGSEVDSAVLDYAEVKALAVGDPMIKKRVEFENELSKYRILQRQITEHYDSLSARLAVIPNEMDRLNDIIEKAESDFAFLQENNCIPKLEERRKIRDMIHDGIMKNARSDTPLFICEYRGFRLSVPANMIAEKPIIIIERSGAYRLALGESPQGYLIRTDNFLNSLDEYAEKRRKRIADLEDEEKSARSQLENKESYSDEIRRLSRKLKLIDKKLGVK